MPIPAAALAALAALDRSAIARDAGRLVRVRSITGDEARRDRHKKLAGWKGKGAVAF